MDELDALLKLAEAGLTAFQTVAIVALWRKGERDSEFIQALLRLELDRNEMDRQASRERGKIADAVGASFDDTEGKRPAGLDELAALRRSIK